MSQGFAKPNLYLHPNHSGDVTSTGDGATVIAAGAVEPAMMDIQPYFKAYQSTAQTLTAVTWEPMAYNTEVKDSDGKYVIGSVVLNSETAGRFTPTVDGWYVAFASGGCNSMADGKLFGMKLMKNAAPAIYYTITTGAATSPYVSLTGLVHLDTNDYLEGWVYNGDSVDRQLGTGDGYANFIVYYLGAGNITP